MNKKVNICSIVFMFLFLTCANSPSQSCRTAKDLMEASIGAINNEDKKEYISLVDFDIVLEMWKKSAVGNSDYLELVEMLKNDKEEVIEMYSISYDIFIRTLKKTHKFDKIDFELIDFKLDKTEKESGYIIERYDMKINNHRNNHWSMKINMSKYNDCYYIMEPLDVNNLSKGW